MTKSQKTINYQLTDIVTLNINRFLNLNESQKHQLNIESLIVEIFETIKEESEKRKIDLSEYLNSDIGQRLVAAKTFSWLRINNILQTSENVLPIWPYKGLLVLNPFLGCSYGCVYCFREDSVKNNPNWFLKGTPIRVYKDEDLVNQLLSHQLFLKDETIIALHAATTDPMLPTVKISTFKMLELLSKKELKNPVLIITKFYLSEDDVKQLAYYTSSMPILLFLTYNSNPPEIEPLGNEPEFLKLRWKTRDILLKYPELKWLHYYRPIVEGWNDSVEQITESLRFGEPSGISVIGGMKAIDGLNEYLQMRNAPIPKGTYNANSKRLSPDLMTKVIDIHKNNNFNSIIVKDQSCAITLLLDRYGRITPNIEAIYKQDIINNTNICTKQCPQSQFELCCNPPSPKINEIEEFLVKIGVFFDSINISSNSLIINAPTNLTENQKYAIIAKFKLPVEISCQGGYC